MRKARIGHYCRRVAFLVCIGGCVLAPSVARAGEPSFGIASFAFAPSARAGAHGDLTTNFTLVTTASGAPAGQLKDMRMVLPAGIVGNPLGVPQCAPSELLVAGCQPPAQVGIAKIDINIVGVTEPVSVPLYNVTPSPGHLATFAASILFAQIVIQADLSEDGSYELVVNVHDVTTLFPIVGATLTLWGVPASPTHDFQRAASQLSGGPRPIYGPNYEIIGYEPTPAGVPPVPFLTNSTDCAGPPLTSTLSVDSWQNPGQYSTQTAIAPAPTGCGQLHISPGLQVTPETTRQDTPAGYNVDLSYPLNEEPFGLGTPALQRATVALPAGTSLSPGVANGLVGCSEEQFAASACPGASKVGTLTVRTPFLADPLTGTVNLAAPTSSAMYRLFLSASADHVSIHLRGVIHLAPSTGQVTLTVEGVPQVPFSDLDLHLFGGPGAALANPPGCGPASTTAQIVSYGGQIATPSASFVVDADGQGGQCPTSLPFAPSLTAGSTSALAGGFSPFTLSVSRNDTQQELSTIAVRLPPGLLGMLSRVPLCGEPEAQQGTCSQASRVGSVTVGAGAGAQPLYLSGATYLTGPYKSSPFGLAIVVPVLAGPFNLGVIVIRAELRVNPTDVHLTIVSDPLPQIVDGIPIRIRTIDLAISRPGFMFNPTACTPQAVTSILGSTQGSTVTLSTPFQASRCQDLPFAARLMASTHAKTNARVNGASLDVKLTNPTGPKANMRSILVELPPQLRSRLTAIRNACLEPPGATSVGECAAQSVVGHMTLRTPVLSTPLRSPIYLVAHGARAYPTLTMLPQGQGVTVALEGSLGIANDGAITAAFSSLPDVPITTIEFELPAGPHAILGPTVPLCHNQLRMPYTITAQNGAKLTHTAPVTVTGCHRARTRHPAAQRGQTGANNTRPRTASWCCRTPPRPRMSDADSTRLDPENRESPRR